MTNFPAMQKGTYRHTKTGRLYEVIGVALQTETDEPLVVYRPLYQNEYELFARPHGLFTEIINLDGQLVPRFQNVAERV